jgi:BlaI family transcriptional regulator, penicillinase repressor
MQKIPEAQTLSRRERQVMDILHRRGGATVAEIMADLPDPPTYSAVRSILRILGEKKIIRHKEDGPLLAHVVKTYFAGSPEQAVTALLRMSDADLPDEDIERLRASISNARLSGR